MLNDTTSGSTEILMKSIKLIEKNIDDFAEIKFTISEFKNHFNSFEIFKQFTNSVNRLIVKNDKDGLKHFLIEFKYHLTNSFNTLYNKNQNFLNPIHSIITLSNSNTILNICKMMKCSGNLKKVYIAESRPMLEGRKLAKSLMKEKIQVELFTDFSASKYFKMSEAVLIGADRILKNKSVINKTGSLTLAILAKEFRIPFYVLATKDKFSTSLKYKQVEMSESEVWSYKNSDLKAANSYFEEVDFKYITKILTD